MLGKKVNGDTTPVYLHFLFPLISFFVVFGFFVSSSAMTLLYRFTKPLLFVFEGFLFVFEDFVLCHKKWHIATTLVNTDFIVVWHGVAFSLNTLLQQ